MSFPWRTVHFEYVYQIVIAAPGDSRSQGRYLQCYFVQISVFIHVRWQGPGLVVFTPGYVSFRAAWIDFIAPHYTRMAGLYWNNPSIGHVTLAANTRTIYLQMQSIWMSGTRRFHLRVPDLQLSCIFSFSDLTKMRWYQDSSTTNGRRTTCPIITPRATTGG